MIVPDFTKSFDFENDFYLSCAPSRLAKSLAQYELYKKTQHLPGQIVECGVFKGASLARFAMLRALLDHNSAKQIIGFDAFGKFPETHFDGDIALREKFIKEAGETGISPTQLIDVLRHKNVHDNVELVQGDILETVPSYIERHPELRISLLNLDVDIYEPAVTVLEHLYPRIVTGGILILDDYAVFPGETEAVDEYFASRNMLVQKFPFSKTPCFIVKE